MGEQILSQDEIDALLGAMASGEVDLKDGDGAEVEQDIPEEVEIYDLTSKGRNFQNQFFALEEVNDKLTKQLQQYFTSALQISIETKFISTEVVSFESFLQGFSSPTCFQIYTMEPLIGSAIMAIEPSLVFSLIDCMFGGDGTPISFERDDFTLIETRLMQKLSLGILDSFEWAWQKVYPIKTKLTKSETKPDYVQLLNPNDLVLSEMFSIKGSKFSGNIYFCMPYLMFEPIKETLSSKFLREKDSKQSWDSQLKQLMNDAFVTVSVDLGRKTCTIRDLLKMQRGDVLTLDAGPDDLVSVHVENVPKYSGYPGIVKGSRAVQISNQITNKNGAET
jgi:flagellar motor switch protein FliM